MTEARAVDAPAGIDDWSTSKYTFAVGAVAATGGAVATAAGGAVVAGTLAVSLTPRSRPSIENSSQSTASAISAGITHRQGEARFTVAVLAVGGT